MTPSKQEQMITDALASIATALHQPHRGTWKAHVDLDGAEHEIEVSLGRDWLLCSTPIGRRPLDGVVGHHSSIPHAGKIVLNSEDDSFALRTDIPLDALSDLEEYRTALTDAFADLVSVPAGVADMDGTQSEDGVAPTPAEVIESCKAACTEMGLPFNEREGHTTVDLELPEGFYQVSLSGWKSRGVRMSVRITDFEAPTSNTRNAIAIALWNANRLIRLAQGVVSETAKGIRVSFDVLFTRAPSCEALGHALAALSVACRLYGDALPSFGEEEVVRRFLAVRGVGSYKQSLSPQRKTDTNRKTARRQNDGRSNRSEGKRRIQTKDGERKRRPGRSDRRRAGQGAAQ